MAALDFPAAPYNGQTFNAPNGAVYQWNATYAAWLPVQTALAAPGGDFTAAAGAGTAPPSTGTDYVSIFPTVLSGNSGNWYNPSNGRFTPPAGRHHIGCMLSFYSSSSSVYGQITLKKNGTKISPSNTSANAHTAGANFYTTMSISMEVDANGTDYFEVNSYCGVLFSGVSGVFWSIPLTTPRPVATAPGDFMAYNSAQIGVGAALVKITLDTVRTGNVGGYYSTSTGRFTPPAGRYYISFTPGFFGSNSVATIAWSYLYKNGVQVVTAGQVPGTANWYGDPESHGIFDCNGTDYFECYMQGNAASAVILANSAVFLAFPISGLIGPPGPPGPPVNSGAQFKARATVNDTLSGPGVIALLRSGIANPVEDYDPDGVYDLANSQFIAPAAGRYHIEAHAFLRNSVANLTGLHMQHVTAGGSQIASYSDLHTSDTNDYGSGFHISADIAMNAGERVRFLYSCNAASTCVAWATGGTSSVSGQLTYVQGYRIA